MKRRLFNLLAAVSLVLCMAVVALWIRSIDFADVWSWSLDATYFRLTSIYGVIGLRMEVPTVRAKALSDKTTFGSSLRYVEYGDFYLGEAAFSRGAPFHGTQEKYIPEMIRSDYGTSRVLGFGYCLKLPLWFVGLVSAILAGFCIYLRRRCYLGAGFCTRCGYDLRASKDRCPECGTAILGKAEG